MEVVTRRPQAFLQPFGYAPEPLVLMLDSDFRHSITPQRLARPGETVHLYLMGLGPTAEPVPTGQPAPLDRMIRIVDNLKCWFSFHRDGSEREWVETLFAGLAPGLTGLYQASLRLPDIAPDRFRYLGCGFSTDPRAEESFLALTPWFLTPSLPLAAAR